MDYKKIIQQSQNQGLPGNIIARKVLLTYPTCVFDGIEERQFEIINSIAEFFQVPILSIQVSGSAKLGHSHFKGTDFKVGESDLDVAIIDYPLFQKYTELIFSHTDGFENQSQFKRKHFESYKYFLAKGIFQPKYMPACNERAKWNEFFGNLSAKNFDLFEEINAVIFMSETFFEYKNQHLGN